MIEWQNPWLPTDSYRVDGAASCGLCGALVEELLKSTHEEWHKKLEETHG